MLKLYEGSTSVCAIKVRLALFEKEIPFESCPIDLRAGAQRNQASRNQQGNSQGQGIGGD